MSRTYKHIAKAKNKSIHSKWLYDKYGFKFMGYDYFSEEYLNTKNKKVKDNLFYYDALIMRRLPSGWNNWNHTRPARADTRKKIRKVILEYLDPDDLTFMDMKKPVQYYY